MISRTAEVATVKTQMADVPPPATHEGEAAAVMPAPDFVSCDPVAMIAKLFVTSAQKKRETDGLTAMAEEHAEDAADAKRIDAMRDKADRTLLAGVVGGASQIASGACSLTGGVLAARDLGTDHAAGASFVAQRWEGAGGAAGGLGKIGEAGLKSHADAADRNIAKEESAAKVAKRAHEALHKEVDAAAQHEGKVIQLLQEIKQAQAQGERAALLRMA